MYQEAGLSITFTKLFSSITESTIWIAPDTHRLCWITMLAMADSRGRVWGSIPGLANRARVSVDDCRSAIRFFMEPDSDSRTKEHEGRRIEEIDGGWRLLNHGKYRAIRDEEAIKESKRKYINTRRAIEKNVENVDRSRAIAEAYTEADTLKPKPPARSPTVSPLDAGEIVERIPMLGGVEFEVRETFTKELERLYPNVDVRATLRQMRGWCIGNPTKMKTPRGIRKFITGWCERDQNGS